MLDQAHMDAELVRVYGLDQGERNLPDALAASVRSLVWIALRVISSSAVWAW